MTAMDAAAATAGGNPGGAPPRRRVAYFYDAEVGNYHFGQGHPMKPHRIRIAHNLVVNYGLYKRMDILRPRLVGRSSLTAFHSDDYVDFLGVVTPDNMSDRQRQLQRHNVGGECPVFDGLFEYCQICASGSILGARRINDDGADVVVNWSGGMHNAKADQASGFGYINDCVLAILELCKKHERVLYVDIDIHHGDGVEEAFYTTNRVMTVDFHKYGENFFPGTGDVLDIGYGEGTNYAINIPLKEGIDDKSYISIFKPVITKAMEVFSPSAIVMQCGANSLSGDPHGCFNLSTRGHGECVRFVKGLNVPTLFLGGGGYSLRSVPRCWAYETAVLLGEEVRDEIPQNDFYEYFGPDYQLHPPVSNMENLNSKEYLEKTMSQVMGILKKLEPKSGMKIQQMGSQVDPRGVAMEIDKSSQSGGGNASQRGYDLPGGQAQGQGLGQLGR